MSVYGTRNNNNKKVMKGGDNCHTGKHSKKVMKGAGRFGYSKQKGGDNCHTGKHSKKVMKGAGGCPTNYKVNQKGSGNCGGNNKVMRGGFIRDHSPMRGVSDKKKCKN